MAKATSGSNGQFTYDFGIAIAQGTLSKITRLTGVTLSLASAFYALKSTASEYVDTLRENTFRFGGVLGTMKAMEQAQNRLIKGQSYFSVDDQLKGMNQLMAAGINVKKNLDWINKAAHASGQSFTQFSGAISNAIAGNMGQLVDMGLITQRATRMFDKYAANTVMRQQAILNFVKTHKGLMAAIRNDFYTIQDQMRRINEVWRAFLQSVLGKPNDPSSFYGQIAQSMKLVADALAKNLEQIKRVGYVIGSVLGWVMKQIGHFVVWIGKQMKQSLGAVWKVTDNYVEFTRSLIVWLEFWKLRIINFFKEYGGTIKDVIKTTLKLFITWKLLSKSFTLGQSAIVSIMNYRREWTRLIKFIHRYGLSTFEGIGRLLEFKFLKKSANREMLRFFGIEPQKVLGQFTQLGYNIGNVLTNGIRSTFAKDFAGLLISPLKVAVKGFLPTLKALTGAIGALGSGGAMGLQAVMGGQADYKSMFQKSIDMLKDGCSDLVDTIKSDFVDKAWGVIKGGCGPMFQYLKSGFKSVGNVIMNLPTIIGAAFNAIKGMWAALNATNPVGWIIIAVTAVAVLYKKCAFVRELVNGMFKAWWEWIKLLWNLLYGAFIGTGVLIKRTWQFFNNWIFQPIANFFKKAWVWIKQMWAAFKDTTVGKFISDYIVTPLKGVFEWIMKGIRWLLKGAASILSVINKSLAEEIRAGEKELGMDKSLAADGGKYQKTDSTDYLKVPDFSFGKDKKEKTPANPISDTTAAVMSTSGSGSAVTNNQNFSKGAIQIIVEKGSNIDENKLAKLIRETIKDVTREQNIRGGTV